METSKLGGGAVNVSLLRTDEEMENIYNKYVNTVYRIALMLLKSVPEAEDVTQTVFIKLMQRNTIFWMYRGEGLSPRARRFLRGR